MVSLSLVIVNWNRREDLLCLLSDLQAQRQPADEIIVVDNGSNDGAPNAVEKYYPNVHLIRLKKNTGLSFGRNVGISEVTSDAIAILDNDLRIPDRNFLAKVRRSLDCHTDCGVISFACIQGLWYCPPPDFQGKVFTLDDLKEMANADQSPVFPQLFYSWFYWATASVVRTSVFETVGLFDDVFGYGGEEWDFAYRCHAAGIRLLCDYSVWAVHVRSPKVRFEGVPSPFLKNMVIAQSRYMPMTDLLLFLILQFAQSSKDAIAAGRLNAFISLCWQVARSWRVQVLSKRRPVMRSIMRRFYYMRLHKTSEYNEIERSTETAWDYYQARFKAKDRETEALSMFVAMYE